MNFQGYNNGQLTKRIDRHHQNIVGSVTSFSVLKTQNFWDPVTVPRKNMLATLTKRAQKFVPVQPNCLNLALNDFVSGIVQRLKLSLETHALGLYIYYGVVLKKLKYSINQLLYASVSVFLASKVVQRDRLIVSLSTLKKAACTYIPKQQYAQAERNIFQALDYNLSIQTFVGFVGFYVWKGILFQREKIMNDLQLHSFEEGIFSKCAEYIRNGTFLRYKPDRLAAYIIFNARKQLGVNGWRREIEAISKFSQSQIQQISAQMKDIDKNVVLPLTIKISNSLKPKEIIFKQKQDLCNSFCDSPKLGIRRQRKLLTSSNVLAPLRTSKSLVTIHQ